MISKEQCRAARALLGWTQDKLATEAGIAPATLRLFERTWKKKHTTGDNTLAAIQSTLEKAGVQFIAENGGGAGVRLAKKARGRK